MCHIVGVVAEIVFYTHVNLSVLTLRCYLWHLHSKDTLNVRYVVGDIVQVVTSRFVVAVIDYFVATVW